MRTEILRLQRRLGITTVYVTHDQVEAMTLGDRVALLRRGELQQVAAPRALYEEPVNMFVAGFMGSPSINFVPAVVTCEDPLEVDCNGLRLAPAVKGQPAGNNTIVAIRPENISISASEAAGGIRVTISLIEPAGSFNWVDVVWGHVVLRGMAPAREELKPGEHAYMSFRHEQALLFEETSGLKI